MQQHVDNVVVLATKVGLAIVELKQALGEAMRESTVALIITSQPFPCVFTKGKAVEDGDLQVRLLVSPGTTRDVVGSVEAKMLMDPSIEAKQKASAKGKKATGPITNARANLSKATPRATFFASLCLTRALHQGVATLSPKFETGTRKTAVKMQFVLRVKADGNDLSVTSSTTKPFIVITNECQVCRSV